MNKAAWLALLISPWVLAQTPQVPLQTDEQGTVYVSPNTAPTETSMAVNGGTLGVQRKDGGGLYGGMDTAGRRPTYSLGASTGGKVSFSAGAESDGAEKKALKAGITVRY